MRFPRLLLWAALAALSFPTLAASPVQLYGQNGGNPTPVQTDASGNLIVTGGGSGSSNVNIHDAAGGNLVSGGGYTDVGALNVTQPDAYAQGTITTGAGSNVALTTPGGNGSCKITVTGTWTGSLTVQGTNDQVPTWSNVNVVTIGGSGIIGSTIGANGIFGADCSAFRQVRVLGPTSTGSAAITIDASSIPSYATLSQSLPNGGNTIGIVNQGTANTSAPVVSSAVESNHVLAGTANHALLSLTVTIGATSGYLMLFNATSAPADGAVTPAYCVPVNSNGTNGSAALLWSSNNAPSFATGITAVFSTTGCFTKTASATAAFFAQVQ